MAWSRAELACSPALWQPLSFAQICASAWIGTAWGVWVEEQEQEQGQEKEEEQEEETGPCSWMLGEGEAGATLQARISTTCLTRCVRGHWHPLCVQHLGRSLHM